MKKYYDIPDSQMVSILDWEKGYGSLEQAKKYFRTDNIREISKKEFNKLGEEYSNKSKEVK